MSLLTKINQSQTKADLKLLEYEIILDHENFYENQGAYVKKLREMDE